MSGLLRGPLLVLLLAVSSCTLGGAGSVMAPGLPPLGSAVVGPRGLIGTVAGQSGGTAMVAPVGGGPLELLVPNGNGTATVFQPGGAPPVVIANPVR